jgi:signal transduction histidine kinase
VGFCIDLAFNLIDMEISGEGVDFHNLFESAPGLYLVLSPELKILAVSNAYLNATLTKREEIISKGIFDVFPDNADDPAASGVGNLRASLQRVLETGAPDAMAVQKYDIQRPESEGGGFEEKYWSPLNTPVFGKNGKVQYIIHRVEDVTEFIKLKNRGTQQHKLTEELKTKADQMETEIFQRAQEIQEANKKLREAEKVKSEFFANVSHELRTPLSLILSPLESILSGKHGEIPSGQQKFLNTIHNNSLRLLQLVNGLLDFSKVEAGKMNVHREPTDIAILIRTILNDFESMMGGKKIDLSYDIAFNNTYVMLDRYLFERILFNLLSNAAKFTEDDGKVFVKAYMEGDNLHLSVTDTGIGIPEAAIKNLFQKFSQVEGSSIRRFEGTGLGLAMVKEFSELLGGSVTVKSEVNKGSTFTVRCLAPITDAKPDENKTAERRSLIPLYQTALVDESKTSDDSLNLPKVLVCEDNQELSAYIVSVLHGICQIKTAPDGERALELVHSWNPDLVLSDVMMPKKDGISVCREIKSNPATSKMSVVLLTALTHREAMMKGWEVKADEYLFKPFHPEELLTRINSLLSVVRDRKNTELILEQKNKQLVEANAELESFSYSVSHDLRAPLRSINGYTKILEEDLNDKLDEQGRRTLNRIIHNASRMNKLIDDLLEFSKLGRKELEKSNIDTTKLVKSIVDEMKPKANVVVDDLIKAQADHALITQVWINLISNAIKYSEKKTNPTVEVGSSLNNGEVIYYVKDNGAGFNMEYSDKLFGVFQRLHKENEFQGTGIGLALVKRIVAKHHGRVWAEGKVNEGATFYFSLPAGSL